MGKPRALLLIAAATLAGCAQLLPRAHNEVASPWRTFDDAKAAIERIVPHETTAEDLRAQRLDPSSANVQLLSYSDIVLRFPVGAGVDPDRLDPGLRECLEAGRSCVGYAIAARDIRRDRVGNYWQDAFGFKRIVDVTGWSFNALILLVDDRVVYTLYGGQPNVREQEISRHPLGPLQGWGDALHLPQFVK